MKYHERAVARNWAVRLRGDAARRRRQPETASADTGCPVLPGRATRPADCTAFSSERSTARSGPRPFRCRCSTFGAFAGGLKPVSKGGGQQTKSLLLQARDGREFFFRSVDKDPSATLPAELRPTVAGDVVRDQTSSALPTAPLVVGPLLEAAGIPHGSSRLYVLPDDPLLGEFRTEFAGLMGFLEERVGGSRPVPAHWEGARRSSIPTR